VGRISSASLNVIDLSTHIATLHGAFPGLCARAALVAICFPRPTIPNLPSLIPKVSHGFESIHPSFQITLIRSSSLELTRCSASNFAQGTQGSGARKFSIISSLHQSSYHQSKTVGFLINMTIIYFDGCSPSDEQSRDL